MFDCLVNGSGTKQHAIETNFAKAGLPDDFSKFFWTVKVTYGM